ncbi:MAG: GerMN domain-containing protein [Spirochaetota bacterium]
MAGRGGGAGTSRGTGNRGGAGAKGGGSAGCLLWLLVFSFIFLLFVINWGKISDTLQRTNFNEILKNQRQNDKGATVAPVKPAPKVDEPLVAAQPGNGQGTAAGGKGATPAKPQGAAPRAGDAIEVPQAEKTKPAKPASPSPVAAAERALTDAQPAKSRAATLYFVRIDDDGVIVRQDVSRLVPQSDSPLTDALVALVRGPNEDELRKHLVSLIPSGTKLISVRMQGTTAVVNLGEAFMYNHYGIEGYAGQLKQIVYTATSFPSVHDVQILIDGERHDYLGGEGVYIGRPLSRNSF